MEGWRDEWDSPVMGKMNQELGGDFNGLSLKKLKRRLTHGAELDEVLCAFSPLSFSLGFHTPVSTSTAGTVPSFETRP